MPRIDAPTVAEHRERQRRALLDAARELLVETGEAPRMAEVGRRAGLARSSVYQYFTSSEDLVQGVVADVFPAWAELVRGRVAAAKDPADRVWAYVEANLELFSGAEQALARALARVADPQVLRGPMEEFHAQLQVPLREALTALGEPEVVEVAALIDAMIMHVASGVPQGDPACATPGPPYDVALARLRRLLGGYL